LGSGGRRAAFSPDNPPFSDWLWPSYLHLPFRPRLRKGSDSVFFKKLLREAQSGRPALAVEEHGAAKGACSFSRWPPSRNHSVAIVAVFLARNYPSTIFSPWMLAQHFYGLFEHNELRSCGGVVVSNLKHGSANLGNFLSSPNHRRRGLAGAVASTLIHDLEAEGLYTFVLATTEENVPARRTYERLGFHVVETRPQVDVCAPGL